MINPLPPSLPDQVYDIDNIVAAIANNEFYTVAQPKVALNDWALCGFEFLARWRHPEDGTVLPGRFIPLLEKTGHLHQLTLALFQRLLDTINTLGEKRNQYSYSFNISPSDLTVPGLVDELIAFLQQKNVTPSKIIIEITETGPLFSKTCQEALRKLNRAGVRLSVDDFWSGFSTLDTLRTGLFSEIKIDYALTSQILNDTTSLAGVSAILRMAEDLNIDCIVEGIETYLARTVLMNHGAKLGQGFLISEGISDEGLATWLECNVNESNLITFTQDDSKTPPLLTTQEKILLQARPQPTWVWSFAEQRIIWGNNSSLNFWSSPCISELVTRDFSDMSFTVRKRLDSYQRRFEAGEDEICSEWVFYPNNMAKKVFCIQLPRIDTATNNLVMLINGFEGMGSRIPNKRFIEECDSVPVPFFIVGERGCIVRVNPLAHIDLDISSDSVFDFMPEEDFKLLGHL